MARQLIAETCGDIRQADRLRHCGRHIRRDHSGDVPIVHHPDGYAYTTGLQTCGSVWACPACSYKIRKKRAAEISQVIAAHTATGGSVLYLTLTMAHAAGEALHDLWSLVQDGWAYCRQGAKWARFRERFGIDGFIRNLEVTHGPSGWHPHLHVLVFVDHQVDPFEIGGTMGLVARYFRRQWITFMEKKHGRVVSAEFGVDLRLVKPDDAPGVGTYCTKAGYEMALADSKVGRAEGNRHPFAIARDAATTGDTTDISLFREWITSSHGRRSITWSTELRAKYGLAADRSDEELASETDDGEVICTVDRELWWQIVSTRTGARARFLALLDTGPTGLAAAVDALTTAGLTVVFEHRSGEPPRLARPNLQTQQRKATQ
ncbi:MAG: protein rep [Acidimicrobiales bacterium]